MKKIGVKSLLNVLYATIILLPMFSIFGRLIYTQANPNAKDSYSDTYITTYNPVVSNNLLQSNENYSINLQTFCDYGKTHVYIRLASGYFNYINPSFEWNTYIKREIDKLTPQEQLDIVGFQLFYADVDTLGLKLMDINNNSIKSLQGNISTYYQNLDKTLYFTLTSLGTFNVGSYTQSWDTNSMFMIGKTINSLDNAFEFSIKTFTDDNNFGNVDFFGWFTNLFLNQSSTKNALYLNFVNWYLNYTLLVSSGYLLFLALIWFINYVRKILDKSMYHDFGGY